MDLSLLDFIYTVAYNNPIAYSNKLLENGKIPASMYNGKELFDFIASITKQYPDLLNSYVEIAGNVAPNLYGQGGSEIAALMENPNELFKDIYNISDIKAGEIVATTEPPTSDYSWLQPVMASLSQLPAIISNFENRNEILQQKLAADQAATVAAQKERDFQNWLIIGGAFFGLAIIVILVLYRKK